MLKKIALLFCFLSFTLSITPAFAEVDFNQTYQLAQKGDAKAQYDLGEMYLSGKGVKPDAEMSFYWLHTSADNGYAKAQYILAVIYEHSQSLSTAKKYYKLACKNGVSEACGK